MGSGGTMISRQVAEGLQLELYDDNKLQQEAVNVEIRSEKLKRLDEKAPNFLDRIQSHKPELYLDIMESVIYEVAQRGQGVIIGHGSQMLLREFGCALHVLIYAPESSRVLHMMDQYELSQRAAKEVILKSDHEKAGFLRYALHIDWNDPSLYDLIINTEKLGTGEAARLIICAAKSQGLRDYGETAMVAMGRLSLKKKIEGEFHRENFNLNVLNIEVPETGLAHVGGWIDTEGDKRRLMMILKQIPGIAHAEVKLSVLPSVAIP
jgi:cytidylate kinase